MKAESRLRNNLREVRTRLGMSQQDVATLAGVTRQTISGVESDLFAPSAAVALKIARALGCRVEDLFWFEEDAPEIAATPAAGAPTGDGLRVALGRVGGRWVAHPLIGEQAFRTELIPADGIGALAPGASTMRVKLLDDLETVTGTVILSGCSPATSLWVRAAQRWNPGLRVHWVFANSMAGLGLLQRGEVQAAGVHLCDPETGEHNVPFVRRTLPDRTVVLINLGIWEEGLLVQAGYAEPRYGDAMVRMAEELGPYVVFGPGFALPHAGIDDGVLRPGFALVRLKHPVPFGHASYDPVDLIFALCAVDYESHLKALMQLAELFGNPDSMAALRAAPDIPAVMALIHQVSALTPEGVD